MVNYSQLNRKMNSELRLSFKKLFAIGVSIVVLFVYALSKNSCSEIKHEKDSIRADNKKAVESYQKANAPPLIYCVTPTYFRPVQKAELTRYELYVFFLPSWLIIIHVRSFKAVAFVSLGAEPLLGDS